jgi:hypothetical protein
MKGVDIMDLVNQIVIHKYFGDGKIIEQSGNYLTIIFDIGEKKFNFPDSFKDFLRAKDKTIDEQIRIFLMKFEEEQKRVNAEKEHMQRLQRQKATAQTSSISKKNNKSAAKTYPRANIAFKCNFCDGGESDEQVGFNGVCSDDIIINNIKIEHRTWCNSEDCPCLSYYNGEISRTELDEKCMDGGLVCYESQMLREWKALAGIVQHGENKGKPMKLNQVQPNSLCILTTRNPQSSEMDRYIFAAFLVDETYAGDGRDEGYVSTSSEYKIKLSPKEARLMRFWDYHSNDNQPETAAWSSGLHRYFKDEQAAQILENIMLLKKGTKDEDLARKFFEHFCNINSLDMDAIPEPFGALKRKHVNNKTFNN